MSFILSTLLLATLPLPAAGQPAFEPPPLPSQEQIAMRMMVRQLLLARYDADRDGQLDEEEQHRLMADAHAARKQEAIAFIRRFDADGDGKLDKEEREAMKQAMQEHRRDKAEEDAEHRRSHAGRPYPQGRKHGARPERPNMGEKGRLFAILTRQLTMDAYDADKNGILDTEESAKLKADGAELCKAREAELLAQFDTDRDGRLSDTELREAMKSLRPRRGQNARRERPHAEGEELPPPPPHRRGPGRNPMRHLLDTHFDIDLLLHLARPQAEEGEPAPCAPSTPSAS